MGKITTYTAATTLFFSCPCVIAISPIYLTGSTRLLIPDANSGKTLATALAILLCAGTLGSAATAVIIPRLVEVYGVSKTTWLSTILAWTLEICCLGYLLTVNTAIPGQREMLPSYKKSISRLPRVFWQLAVVCAAIYGSVSPFNNSAQRFLSSRFYGGDESAAGLAASIPNILSGVLVLPFGLLLEYPRLRNYPALILLSGSLLSVAHTCFLLQISRSGLPLVLLGVGYTAFGAAFWLAMSSCILESSSAGKSIPLRVSRVSLLDDRNSDDSGSKSPNEEDKAYVSDLGSTGNQDLVVIGFGIISSVANLSIGIVPLFLAGLEIMAGYEGLEMMFVALSMVSVVAAIRLVKMDRVS